MPPSTIPIAFGLACLLAAYLIAIGYFFGRWAEKTGRQKGEQTLQELYQDAQTAAKKYRFAKINIYRSISLATEILSGYQILSSDKFCILYRINNNQVEVISLRDVDRIEIEPVAQLKS